MWQSPIPTFFLTTFLALTCTACSAPGPAAIPSTSQALVVLKTVRLPSSEPWYSRFAHHSWIDLYEPGQGLWTRIEANTTPEIFEISGEQAYEAKRWGRKVSLLLVLVGPQAKSVIPDLKREGKRKQTGFEYRAFPGPNSNTYISRILRAVPGLSAELNHNAVGKNYTPVISAGLNVASDGVYLDTALLGASTGYLTGVEIHVLGLTAGLGFWPPGIKLPILPRLGFPLGNTRLPD